MIRFHSIFILSFLSEYFAFLYVILPAICMPFHSTDIVLYVAASYLIQQISAISIGQ